MKNNGPTRLYRLAAALATMLALLVLAPPQAYSQVGGCDPAYMSALRGRATVEARREVAQNKNLIYKEDSVLEYSCFFSHLTNIATQSTLLTTEATPVDQGGIDVVATTPGFNFLANNFGHIYLGGRYETGTPTLPNGAYFCDAQAKMWEFARCINMHEYTGADSFFDFKWYMGNDPRIYPDDYAKCVPVVQDVDLRVAFRGLQETWLTRNNGEVQPDTLQYGTDPVTTYLPLTRWDVAGGDTCGDPIPTGLQVVRKNTSYPEKICAKPGCTLVGDRCVQ